MATEEQKRAAIAHVLTRAAIAEECGLLSTAQSWRDYAMELSQRPAAEVVIARPLSLNVE